MSDSADMASTTRPPRLAWSRAADWICALGLLGLWLITRPYRGVRHDAILYTGQMLARLLPDRLGPDLFFFYGSQDKYSVFSWLAAPLVARFGIGPTELVLLLLCNLLFAVACWNLMAPWIPRPLCWLGLLFVSVLPHTYGGLGAFSYAEPFLTARSFGEPFALLALSQLLRRRFAAACAFALLGMAFHPLIVLPVLIVGWGVLIQGRVRWLWLALFLVVPLGLAIAGTPPFAGLLQRYDADWLPIVQVHNANAFIASYNVLDWAPLAFDAIVLGLCLRLEAIAPALRRAIKSVLASVALLTVLWWLGADVLHDVLLTQLQLWRIYWPLHLLAMMLLPWVGVEFWQRGWVGVWCVGALILAAVAVLSNWETGWLCVAWALLAVLADFIRTKVSRPVAIAAAVASLVATLAISVRVAQFTQMAVDQFPDRFGHVVPAMIVIGLPPVGALLALVLVALAGTGASGRAAAVAFAAAGVLFGVAVWDQRSPWQLRLESQAVAAAPLFDSEIPAGATVYWEGNVVEPWLLARRASFLSDEQSSGLLFNRATALEYARRERVVAPFEAQREICGAIAHAAVQRQSAPPPCALPVESVLTVCRASAHPDFLVFAKPLPLPAEAEWHDLKPGLGAAGHSFYLYSCARLR